MAYIGRDTDKLSNIEVLDAITFDGSSSYTLQKNSVNFTPSSANNVLVSIDGVVQANNFTVSGSTIDFGVAVPGTSTCDWIYHMGVGLITTPADGTVTTAKLADSSVTSAKLSGVTQGITEVDVWMVTADTNSGTDADITTNLARASTQISGKGLTYIGTGMTESSGIFSFPSTGIWRIDVNLQANVAPTDNGFLYVNVTTDNSTYYTLNAAGVSNKDASGTQAGVDTGNVSTIIDVTDTSNVKVKFSTSSFAAGTVVNGNTSQPIETYFMFTRLGDT